jgi:hypothetical protein
MNEELTDLVRGRTIELVSKEGGLVVIRFNDLSTLYIQTTGLPDMNVLGEGRIVGAEEEGDKLFLYGEEDRAAVYQLARPGPSITLKNQDGDVEFSGEPAGSTGRLG